MKNLYLIVVLVVLQGCATGANYQKEKPLAVDQSFWDGRRFIQDNQVVNYSQATSALKANPKSANLMSGAELLDAGTGLFAIGGGVMFGYGLGSLARSDGGQPVLIAGGVASVLIAVLFSSGANEKHSQSVEIHNSELSKPKGSGFKITPSGFAFNF